MDFTKPESVCAVIDKFGAGESRRAKVLDVAEKTGIGRTTLWRYMAEGVPVRSKMAARALQVLAVE